MAIAQETVSVRPSRYSTPVLLIGLLATFTIADASSASSLAHEYAIGTSISLGLSFLLDYRGNLRNLVRTDVLSLVSLYFFTLAEYLISQPALLDEKLSIEMARPALDACLLAFVGLTIGRHLAPKPFRMMIKLSVFESSSKLMIGAFYFCLVGGFSYMLVVVNFDLIFMIECFMGPRFSQPWGRGQLGDFKALLYEFSMLLYLVPPIAGTILSDRKKYSALTRAGVIISFLFLLFYAFSSGTRNIFGTYLATFTVAYAFSAKKQSKKETIAVIAITATAMVMATMYMLEFRNIGFRNYVEGASRRDIEEADRKFYVDNNIVPIAFLMQVFPNKYDYLGMEIPYLSLIRIIPRAVWPDKPKGLSVTIEKALDAEDLGCTIAATFIGEAYMSNGFLGVIYFSIFFGMFAGWWNHFGRTNNSEFGNLIFSSGFFAAVMSMRSCYIFTTTILPTLVVITFGIWTINRRIERKKRVETTDSESLPGDK